MKRENQTAGSF